MELSEEETGKSSVEDEVCGRLDVKRALDSLPAELKEAAILYYFQELKQREIADILGIGLPLVKYRISRAKEEMKKLLGEEEEK